METHQRVAYAHAYPPRTGKGSRGGRSHAPYASVFAIVHEPLPIVLVESASCLGRHIPIAPYGPPVSTALDRSALVSMGNGVAVIPANHGLLAVGATLPHAYDATLAAETTSRLVILARSMKAEPFPLPPDVVEGWHERYSRDCRRTISERIEHTEVLSACRTFFQP